MRRWIFALALIAASSASAEVLHGIGKSSNRFVDWAEVILDLDDAHPKISIRFSEDRSFYDCKFVITQKPTKQDALMGYFFMPGSGDGQSPCILRVDLWNNQKEFYLYDPAMASNEVFTGRFGPAPKS